MLQIKEDDRQANWQEYKEQCDKDTNEAREETKKMEKARDLSNEENLEKIKEVKAVREEMEELLKEKGVVDMLNKELQSLLDTARQEGEMWKKKEEQYMQNGGYLNPDSPNRLERNESDLSPSKYLEVSAAQGSEQEL